MSPRLRTTLSYVTVGVLSAIVGAAVAYRATLRPVVLGETRLVGTEEVSLKLHKVSVSTHICCKVNAKLLLIGASEQGVVHNPTSVQVPIQPAGFPQDSKNYTLLLMVWDVPTMLLTLDGADFLKLESIEVKFNELDKVAAITTTPDIGLKSMDLRSAAR